MQLRVGYCAVRMVSAEWSNSPQSLTASLGDVAGPGQGREGISDLRRSWQAKILEHRDYVSGTNHAAIATRFDDSGESERLIGDAEKLHSYSDRPRLCRGH